MSWVQGMFPGGVADGVSEAGSGFRVGWRAAGVGFPFFGGFFYGIGGAFILAGGVGDGQLFYIPCL